MATGLGWVAILTSLGAAALFGLLLFGEALGGLGHPHGREEPGPSLFGLAAVGVVHLFLAMGWFAGSSFTWRLHLVTVLATMAGAGWAAGSAAWPFEIVGFGVLAVLATRQAREWGSGSGTEPPRG